MKRITYTGDNPAESVEGIGTFVRGEPRDLEVTDEQARALSRKQFTVDDIPAATRPARKKVEE